MMRRLRIAAAILIGLAIVTVLTLRVVGFPPKERRPGLWLPGEVVTTPVTDWSFTDASPQIQLQTQSGFLLPHSVTIACATLDGRLYLATTLPKGTVPPGGRPQRRWTRNVDANPHIRVRVSNRLYDLRATFVVDAAERERVFHAYAKKYPALPQFSDQAALDRVEMFYWRTDAL